MAPCYRRAVTTWLVRRVLRVAGVSAWALVVAVGAMGCDALNSVGPEICKRPENKEPFEYTEGTITGGTYRTADWNDELIYFPGGAHFRIHHDLGAIPVGVQLYVSFARYGLEEDGEGGDNGEQTGSIAPAAGNQVEIKEITDTTIRVLNGSCSDYYLLAVMWTEDGGPTGDSDGTGGATASSEP